MKIKLLFFVVFLFDITSSFAHQPILNNEEEMSSNKPYVIENPEISKAIYSTLNGTDHFYVISSDKSFNFYAGLTVPKIDECDDFLRFSFAVLDSDFHIIQEFDGQNYQWWEWYESYGKNGTGWVLNMGKILKVQTYLMQALITLKSTIKITLGNMC